MTNKSGFSLVEVALAVLLVAIGLTSIFALFPLGLQQSDGAIQDTQEAMFADYVLNTIEGNCLSITNWAHWNPPSAIPVADFSTFVAKAIDKIDPDLVPGIGSWQDYTVAGVVGRRVQRTGVNTAVKFPTDTQFVAKGSPRYLRYELTIRNEDARGTTKQIDLSVKSGRYGGFDYPQTYSTKVVFLGM